jgi:fused signal recognition particle receptor
VEITDVMISKLDSTAKGGIAFSVARQLGTPVAYVGTGEQATDSAEFKAETYVDALFFGVEEGF